MCACAQEESDSADLSRIYNVKSSPLKKKTMRRDPPPVKRHTRGRPSNLPPPLSTDLASELPAAGTEGHKRKSVPVNKARACISHDSPLMSDLPWLHLLCSPPGDHSSCRHTHTHRARGGWEAQPVYLCRIAASWNRHGGHCIISWFFLCPKYLICINSIAAALSYLH